MPTEPRRNLVAAGAVVLAASLGLLVVAAAVGAWGGSRANAAALDDADVELPASLRINETEDWVLSAGTYELRTRPVLFSMAEQAREAAGDSLAVRGPADAPEPRPLAVREVSRTGTSTTYSFEVTDKGHYVFDLHGDEGLADITRIARPPRDRTAGRMPGVVAWTLSGLSGVVFLGGVALVVMGLLRRRRTTAPVP
jgi:hypothetical protein